MNQLYPIFLKTEKLHFLIVGGGFVGTEKLENLLKSSPNSKVSLVSPEIREEIYEIAEGNGLIRLIKEPFQEKHVKGIDVAILATNIKSLNAEIRATIKKHGILVNVADTPDLCDFYMCSVVTKGDLKIGISTNGKSPTLAKRLRELFTEALPDEIPQLLDSLQTFRNKLKGDFAYKVKRLDELTKELRE